MKTKKILLILFGMLLITILFVNNKTYAALQANGSTATTQTPDNWIVNIRKMEAIGGTLGLTETINSSTLLSTSGSNNLDIHMEKNTEYGAIAILSASSYGNPNKVTSGGTTTGNETGIVMNLNNEWVAAGGLTDKAIFTTSNGRYRNSYGENYVAKVGDAINETKNWHGGSSSTYWMYYDPRIASGTRILGVVRANSGSIFSYSTDSNVAYYNKAWYSRAIMVCGEGV
jgi:hypothetical protein